MKDIQYDKNYPFKRKLILNVISQICPDGIGVEIGVKGGCTSEMLLDNLPLKHIYMVDPWEGDDYTIATGPECPVLQTLDRGKVYKLVCDKFNNKFFERHTIIKQKSNECVNLIPENLDFAFIDGDHTYDAVYLDLELYVPKIKRGGLLIGDDYELKQVRRAVEKYTKEHRSYFLLDENVIDGFKKGKFVYESNEYNIWYILKR